MSDENDDPVVAMLGAEIARLRSDIEILQEAMSMAHAEIMVGDYESAMAWLEGKA